MIQETYYGYSICHKWISFLNNPDLLLWEARKPQGKSKMPFVILRAERKQDLKDMIKALIKNNKNK